MCPTASSGPAVDTPPDSAFGLVLPFRLRLLLLLLIHVLLLIILLLHCTITEITPLVEDIHRSEKMRTSCLEVLSADLAIELAPTGLLLELHDNRALMLADHAVESASGCCGVF